MEEAVVKICEAASRLRIIRLFTGSKGSDAFSGFGEMCPRLMMNWHPRVRAGA